MGATGEASWGYNTSRRIRPLSTVNWIHIRNNEVEHLVVEGEFCQGLSRILSHWLEIQFQMQLDKSDENWCERLPWPPVLESL